MKSIINWFKNRNLPKETLQTIETPPPATPKQVEEFNKLLDKRGHTL